MVKRTQAGDAGANGNGGGVYGLYGADIDIKDTIFWHNVGIDGSQIALYNGELETIPTELSVTYSDVDLRYGKDLEFLGSGSGAASGSGTASLLIDSQTIYDEINSSGSAKVIVSLEDPADLRDGTEEPIRLLSLYRSRAQSGSPAETYPVEERGW